MRDFFRRKRLGASIFFASLFIITSFITISCSSNKELIVKPLFRQSQRVNVELPTEGWFVDSITGSVIASEIVVYTNEDRGGEYYKMDSVINTPITGETDMVDLTKGVHRLRSVEVKAKYRFAPEREGYINTDFLIVVPKGLISTDWRVVVDPILIHNDSLVSLKRVIVKGQEFAKKQKESYAEYRKFLGTLVSKPEYDKYFLDKKSVARDVKKQQTHYFDQYYNAWSKRVNFEKWKFDREDQDAFYYAKRMGYNFKKYNEYALKTLLETHPDERGTKISLGLSDEYRKKYEKVTEGFPSLWKQEVMTEKVVPRRYRQTFRDGIAAKDIVNKYVTESDIRKISDNRYYFDEIAMNESAINRRHDIFKTMVRYPYDDPQRVYLDSIVEGKEDFLLHYRHAYQVVEGLKNVRVTLQSQVQAIDRSTYRTSAADTITYVVSSLSQLMDTTLIGKKNIVSRYASDSTTMYFEYPANDVRFNINYTINRAEMKKFLDLYERSKKNGFTVDDITLIGSTSLDGMASANERLSASRLEDVRGYISRMNPELSKIIKTRNIGEDINTALVLIERSDDLFDNKEAILDKLKNNKNKDAAEVEVRYAFKNDYQKMRDHIYPKLRKVEAVFNMHRYNEDQYQVAIEQAKKDYAEGLRLLEDRQYTRSYELLEQFSDYNTALVLTCLGRNTDAYELLKQLDQNAENDYLMAIVLFRMNNDRMAIDHLMRACEQDHAKVYRTNLDSETKMLVLKYSLQSRLDGIVEKYIKTQLDEEVKSDDENSEDGAESDIDNQNVSAGN